MLFALLIIGAVWAIVATGSGSTDYAKEMIKPIGQSLTNKGATFVCDGGNAGRGIDNRVPYNRAYYKVAATGDHVVNLATQAAAENGYHLVPDDRNKQYDTPNQIKWYDNVSKVSPYPELEDGNVELKVIIEKPGSKDPCNPSQTLDSSHSLIGIDVTMPAFKLEK